MGRAARLDICRAARLWGCMSFGRSHRISRLYNLVVRVTLCVRCGGTYMHVLLWCTLCTRGAAVPTYPGCAMYAGPMPGTEACIFGTPRGIAGCTTGHRRFAARRGTILRHCQRSSTGEECGHNCESLQGSHVRTPKTQRLSPRAVR